MKQMSRGHGKRAFTLVELMVVVGIISLLISLLLPAVQRAQKSAKAIACKSNLRQIGTMLVIYANNNNGIIYPVGSIVTAQERWPNGGSRGKIGTFRTLGTGSYYGYHEHPEYLKPGQDPETSSLVPNTDRWPVYVFDPPDWNPKIMVCSEDVEVYSSPYGEQHSYMLNKHLEESPQRQVKISDSHIDGIASDGEEFRRTVSEIVVMGEKITNIGDYYMETNDFDDKVDPFRHGIKLGSNFLYMDWHVETVPPALVKDTLDPWDPVPQVAPVVPPVTGP